MSHNLVSVSWRPRKAGSVIQLESVGLRNKRELMLELPVQG